MCQILKTLSNELQPFHKALQLITETLASKKGDDKRVLAHLLSYAEFQFGNKKTGISYREREDGTRFSNWKADITILNIIKILSTLYNEDQSLGRIMSENLRFPLLERSLNLLNPWLIHLDSNTSDQSEGHDEGQINYLLHELFRTEQNMAAVFINRRQFDRAEEHCQRCLAYSRLYGLEGELKVDMIFSALSSYSKLRLLQQNYPSALIFAEECYNFVVEAYDPVHPQVQEAAGILINLLITKGDFYNAERYAEVTYSNLRDKKNGMDQESEAVANGAFNLANIILRQKVDLIKAEELARESLRIRTLVYGRNHETVGSSCDLLASILMGQGNFGDETKELYERALKVMIKVDGPDGSNVAAVHMNFGRFYYNFAEIQQTITLKRSKLLLAKFHVEETYRIYSNIYGPSYSDTVDAKTRLITLQQELSYC
jgi:hypothetical protein